jgi:hypothetical protein
LQPATAALRQTWLRRLLERSESSHDHASLARLLMDRLRTDLSVRLKPTHWHTSVPRVPSGRFGLGWTTASRDLNLLECNLACE